MSYYILQFFICCKFYLNSGFFCKCICHFLPHLRTITCLNCGYTDCCSRIGCVWIIRCWLLCCLCSCFFCFALSDTEVSVPVSVPHPANKDLPLPCSSCTQNFFLHSNLPFLLIFTIILVFSFLQLLL